MHSCACVYVCVYIYIDVCVCLWISGQRRDLIFSILLGASDCLEGLLCLSILARRPHREHESARLDVRDEKDVGHWLVRSGTPAVRESHIQGLLCEAGQLRLGRQA